MANKDLFPGAASARLPAADTLNEAGGRAYSLASEQALAQLAATGTFNDTFYAPGAKQLEAIREVADRCHPLFIAKTALWSRRKGAMKDMPAALCAMLSKADARLLDVVFERVIDNGRMLRNFVQMVRSGAFGRKSLGSGPRRLVRRWLESRSDAALFKASVGNDPSLADVIALAHPRPTTDARRALYGWLRGREQVDAAKLPDVVKAFEAWKRGETTEVPDVDFRLLTSGELSREQWAAIARRGAFTQTRINLNTYLRHGVYDVPGMEDVIAAKLRDREAIRAARVLPFQLLAAYLNVEEKVPWKVRDALHDAVEIATENVEAYGTEVAVLVDVSGSMSSPVTGGRGGATSKVRCVDAAALVASVILRRNPGSHVLPVDTRVHADARVDARDSILGNARKLAAFGGGGTDLAAGLRHLNEAGVRAGLVVVVSDNESWVDSLGGRYSRATGTLTEFRGLQKRSPGAKLVCLNLQPNATTQAKDAPAEVLNIGGFTDAVFETIGKFVRGTKAAPVDWVAEIRAVDVFGPPLAPHGGPAASDEGEEPASE